MDNRDEFYANLRQTLVEQTKFPTTYLYKFIIPNEEKNIKIILKIFDFQGAVITSKKSKTNKFKSYTIHVKVKNVDEIIQKYQEVSVIEGVISL
ncbi:MAG: DUF493 family protein [Bacteroidetes bacterium]|nr:DUF493 family protein [Bacteroidota bacterium]